MAFVTALRGERYFRVHFLEPKLVDTTWLSEGSKEYLEFDIFCPLAGPEAIREGIHLLQRENRDMIDPEEMDEPEDVGTGSEDMGEHGEGAS